MNGKVKQYYFTSGEESEKNHTILFLSFLHSLFFLFFSVLRAKKKLTKNFHQINQLEVKMN